MMHRVSISLLNETLSSKENFRFRLGLLKALTSKVSSYHPFLSL